MVNLTAVFELVDKISDKLDAIANKGSGTVDQFEAMGDAADQSFTGATSAADGVVSAVSSYSQATTEAAAQTDFWTNAVGNYDKGALEAIYSTEELVEMGMKSAEALEHEANIMEKCERATQELSDALEQSSKLQDEYTSAMEKANRISDEVADNDKVSTQAKERLQSATEEAVQAFDELERAQNAAQSAMDNYDRVVSSGTARLEDMEKAAEQAAKAADDLTVANERAANATTELSDATQEAEKGGKSGKEAVEGIASALAAAGITKTVKEIATSVYEMAENFSEAEKIIATSSGATGQELEELKQTAMSVFSNTNAESVEDIAAGMSAIATATNLTGEALEDATEKGYQMQDLFGYEMSESARTASALMKNFGIDASEAYDIITVGAQSGADKNGDLLDILNEYSVQYAALGLSADEFLQSLINGADAGVFSIDKVGDAVKEFNIRAKDGSDTTAEAFEALGMNADIMTEKFAAGGETASTAFFDVVAALESMEDPVQRNAVAVSLFGTMYEDLEGDLLPILSNIESGTIDTTDALEKTAEGAESVGDKWTKAGNNIQTAFSNAMQPTIEGVSSGFADIMNGIGDFLNEHPVVTKAITAIGVGLGVVITAMAAVAFTTTVAIPAITAFGVALNTALGPIGWVALAITGVVAAGTALVAMMNDTEDETAGMTAVTRQQYYQLQDLNTEYDEAVAKYGENSEEALRLQYQIEDLSEAFENSRQTLEEFQAEVDDLCASVSGLWTEFDSAISEINAAETGTLALIQKYDDLISQTTLTAAEQKQLEAVTKSLSESYPELTAQMENATLSAEQYVEALKKAAEQEAQEQREAEAQDAYVEAIKKRAELTEELEKAQANYNAELEAHDMVWDEAMGKYTNGLYTADSPWASWTTDLDEYKDALDSVNGSIEENEARIAELEAGFEKLAQKEQEAAEAGVSYEEACSTALSEVKDRFYELCAAYDEAYQSALDSFSGQFGLFDEASTKSEEYLNASVENAQKALDSQLSYWETYNANLETLTSYGEGLTGEARENYELLLSYAQDGSEEATGLAASMADAIEKGDTDAINKLSETVGAVREKQEEAAAATAEWQTDFNAQMDEIVSGMSDRIGEMGFEDEANQAALKTMQNYAAGIQAGSNEAITKVEAVATAISGALEKSDVKAKINIEPNTDAVDSYEMPDKTATAEYELDSETVDKYQPEDKEADAVYEVDDTAVDNWDPPDKTATVTYNVQTSGTVPGHAAGTTYAEDMFIAGENGPELIVGQQGSTVFPHSETEQIIDAMSKRNEAVTVVNEYEPTGFMDMLENAVSKLTGKMSALFEKLGGITPTVELAGYATGTTSSDDSFIAGENGPELIVDKPDSTVFPADETDRIINAISTSSISRTTGQQDGIFVPTGNDNGLIEDSGTEKDASTRKILLEIAGKGNIELTGGKADKETLLAFLYEYLKPVLSEILTQEIYEEGDMAYEY